MAKARKPKTYDFLFKILLIGDPDTGKPALLRSFANEEIFDSTFISTIGIDFKIRNIIVDEQRVKLQIWDTAGQARFRTITSSYYRGVTGIMLVYDITNQASFDHITADWIPEIRQHVGDEVALMILGNKCHLEDKRQVSKERGEQVSREHGIPFMETSAKGNLNTEEALTKLTRKMLCNNLLVSVNKVIDAEEEPSKTEEQSTWFSIKKTVKMAFGVSSRSQRNVPTLPPASPPIARLPTKSKQRKTFSRKTFSKSGPELDTPQIVIPPNLESVDSESETTTTETTTSTTQTSTTTSAASSATHLDQPLTATSSSTPIGAAQNTTTNSSSTTTTTTSSSTSTATSATTSTSLNTTPNASAITPATLSASEFAARCQSLVAPIHQLVRDELELPSGETGGGCSVETSSQVVGQQDQGNLTVNVIFNYTAKSYKKIINVKKTSKNVTCNELKVRKTNLMAVGSTIKNIHRHRRRKKDRNDSQSNVDSDEDEEYEEINEESGDDDDEDDDGDEDDDDDDGVKDDDDGDDKDDNNDKNDDDDDKDGDDNKDDGVKNDDVDGDKDHDDDDKADGDNGDNNDKDDGINNDDVDKVDGDKDHDDKCDDDDDDESHSDKEEEESMKESQSKTVENE